MDVCCECCVLSGRGLCDELVTRPDESCRLCCVVVCDLETSWMRKPWPTGACWTKNKYNVLCYLFAATCFGAIDILKKLTPMLLKLTEIKQFYSDHSYQMCSFELKYTVFRMLL